ncbi:MAG: double zinc ribbon domain-containing protein, partial [Butyricimonas faecihominis]
MKDNKPEPPKAPVEEPKKEQDEKPEPLKEPEEKDMVICKRCQTKQRITNQYCKHCGESFVPLERCGKCGREVPKNAIYCPFCG